jgi:hypothetical protein
MGGCSLWISNFEYDNMTYISFLAFVKFGDKTFKIVVEIVGLRIGTLVAPNNEVSLEIYRAGF